MLHRITVVICTRSGVEHMKIEDVEIFIDELFSVDDSLSNKLLFKMIGVHKAMLRSDNPVNRNAAIDFFEELQRAYNDLI